MAEIEIRSILVSECYTNCYLCKNKESGEGFIVDPGGNELKISTHISQIEMKPVAILLTHGHFDHIEAVDALRKRYEIPVYISAKEEHLMLDNRMNLSSFFGEPLSVCADKFLQDGQKLTIAGIDMKFILTPGHTQGSGCYYLEENEVLFSGDTLFCASRGRTDFPSGSEATIIKSIREKLLVLPEETEVFPGHNESTTIGAEKVYYI
jgi:glyoxylase-like metal-dependent hydrolase (beta-lactamase superfamily II)